jgi:hypothetical protein
MPQSELRLIKRCTEFVSKEEVRSIPRRLRGIYVLYKERVRQKSQKYDVVYVGMAKAGRRGGIRGRLWSHFKRKGDLWTHFSAFEVWDNIRDEEVAELEGLFRHIYRLDTRANRLNIQRGFKKVRKVQQDDLRRWKVCGIYRPRLAGKLTRELEDGDILRSYQLLRLVAGLDVSRGDQLRIIAPQANRGLVAGIEFLQGVLAPDCAARVRVIHVEGLVSELQRQAPTPRLEMHLEAFAEKYIPP